MLIIATTTKKAMSLLGGTGYGPTEKLNEMVQFDAFRSVFYALNVESRDLFSLY